MAAIETEGGVREKRALRVNDNVSMTEMSAHPSQAGAKSFSRNYEIRSDCIKFLDRSFFNYSVRQKINNRNVTICLMPLWNVLI